MTRIVNKKSKKPNRRPVRKVSPVQSSPGITFETAPSIAGGKFQDHLIICYGPPKIGKSTLFSHFPGAYFIATEPGYKALKVMKTDITAKSGVEMWKNFKNIVDTSIRNPASIEHISMWVIDTATNLSKACMEYTCDVAGVDHPSDQEWGKGWEAYANEFSAQILALASTGKGIAFIAHQSTIEILSRRMRITKEAPDLPKTTYRIVNNMADIILQMGYVQHSPKSEELGEMRCLFTKPTETRDAGDRTGALPEVIKFTNEKQAALKILKAFNSSK